MFMRAWWSFFIVTCLTVPDGALAQVSEAEESEVIKPAAGPTAPDNAPDLSQAGKLIVRQTNQLREERKRSPVELHPKLEETARNFADYMARTNKYGHTADGKRPSTRAKEHGYEYCLVSENIAYQYSSAGFSTEDLASRFVKGWKESPGHRKNMLEQGVTETGVAIARSEESGVYYAVQMFARPKSLSITFRIANQSSTEVEYQIGERTFPLPPRLTRTHETCRDPEITFDWPNGDLSTIEPGDQDHYIVVDQGDRLRLQRE